MKEQDLYWLAGLLEGEAYFTYNGTARIDLQMTDKDIVERAAILLHGVNIVERISNNPKHKNVYRCVLNGEKAVDIMKQILPIMGKRRQARIQQIIERQTGRTNTWSNKRKLDDTLIAMVKSMHNNGIGANVIALHMSGITNTYISRFNISDILRGVTGANVE